MIKVLHVIGGMNIGGAETMIMNIFRNIDLNSFKFDFYIDFDGDNYYAEEIHSYGGNIYYSGGGKSKHPMRYLTRLFSLLKKREYDVIHVHTSNASAFLPLFIAQIVGVKKRIVHSHNTTGINETRQKIQRCLLYWCSTDMLSCGLEAAKWMYGKKYDHAKIINLPVDCKRMQFDICKRKRNIETWNAENKVIYGHIGRMNKQKNPLYLIELFSEIHRLNENAILVYVGDGDMYHEVVYLIKQNSLEDAVIIIPKVPNASEVLNGMDAFLLPSLYEGFPTVAIEAQANGLPCFLSDTITGDICITSLVNFFSLKDDKSSIAAFIVNNTKSRIDSEKSYERYSAEVGAQYDASIITEQVSKIYTN